ncbi:nitrous oxide reductase family maturation protein NosD [Patescibacteria group bacterium]
MFFVSLILLATNVSAATIHVPSYAPTIQAGVDSAQVGDNVLVSAGTYYEHDIIMKAGVTLASESGAASTIIDAQGLGRGILIQGIDNVLINGFTVMNGLKDYGAGIRVWGGTGNRVENCVITLCHSTVRGAGMNIRSCVADVVNCEIYNNSSDGGGGGLDCFNASPNIESCNIHDNSAVWYGGGIECYENSSATINGCVITDNTCLEGGGVYLSNASHATITWNLIARNSAGGNGAGGIAIWNWSHPNIAYNTIVGNSTSDRAGGINCLNDCQPTIDHNIIAFNEGPAFYCNGTVNPQVSCNDLFGNTGGNSFCGTDVGNNIYEDPLFCSAESGNYHLESDSPCLSGACGQIGVYGNGCGAVPTKEVTWGAVKAMYQ